MSQNNELELIEKMRELTRAASVADLIESAAKISSSLVGAKDIVFYLLDETKRFLVPASKQSHSIKKKTTETYFKPIPTRLNGVDNKTNPCVYAITSGSTVCIDDVYQYSGYSLDEIYAYDKTSEARTVALWGIPFKGKTDFFIGVAMLMFDVKSPDKIDFSQPFFAIVGSLIENLRHMEVAEYSLDVLTDFKTQLEEENKQLKQKISTKNYDYSEIIGTSKSIKTVLNLLDKAIDTDVTVMVNGETGTGKELIAKAVHFNGRRREKEFVVQNCATLPENLLESELFGYRKGAFSGAIRDKKGLFELANGGTLFLDEIGDLPLNLQAKLLRVVQNKEIRPLGSERSVYVDVRIVVATHKNLFEMVKEGRFREDLYYRLTVFPVLLPPLRDRKEDIPLLIKHFLKILQNEHGKVVNGINRRVLDALVRYDYPGNIRELKNIVERMIVLCDANELLTEDLLPTEILPPTDVVNVDAKDGDGLRSRVAEYEEKLIREALSDSNWNQTKAAIYLQIGRRTLLEKIQRYNIKPSKYTALQ